MRPEGCQVVDNLRLSILSQSVQCSSDLKTHLNEVRKACSDALRQATSLSTEVSNALNKVSLLPDGVRRAAELQNTMIIALQNTSELEAAARGSCEANAAVIIALGQLHDDIACLTNYDVMGAVETGCMEETVTAESDENDEREEDEGGGDEEETEDLDEDEEDTDSDVSAFTIDWGNVEFEDEEEDAEEVNEFNDVKSLITRLNVHGSSSHSSTPVTTAVGLPASSTEAVGAAVQVSSTQPLLLPSIHTTSILERSRLINYVAPLPHTSMSILISDSTQAHMT